MNEVTRILSAMERGDPQAAEQLLPLVYDELRRLAAQRLAQEKPGQTLQATALVHEAYLRLVGADDARRWDSRGHFFAAAAEAMRRILVDNARRKEAREARRRPRGASSRSSTTSPSPTPRRTTCSPSTRPWHGSRADDPVKAELVKLRFFAGLTVEEAAEASASRRAPPTATGPTPAPGSLRGARPTPSPEPNRARRRDSGLRGRMAASTDRSAISAARPGRAPRPRSPRRGSARDGLPGRRTRAIE